MISVIIPIYNVDKYLYKCIDSVLKQTYSDFELLLIDDGSKDLSGNICKEYEQKDKRVHYIWKENGGVSSARNEGIKRAKGDYIVFIDSDDFIADDFLEHLINTNKVDFSMCGYEIYDALNKVTLNRYECQKVSGSLNDLAKNIRLYLETPFLLGPCFKLFKTDIIKNNYVHFPQDLSYGEDAIFVFDYLKYCESISITPYIGYYYCRQGNESLSKKFLVDKIDINFRINKKIELLLDQENIEDRSIILADRILECFVSYTKELTNSNLSEDQKRKVFYEKYNLYSSYFGEPKRFAQKLIIFIGKHKFSYPMIHLFKLKRK